MKNNMQKILSLVLSIMLVAALAVNFTGCSNKAPEAPAAVGISEGAVLGQGATEFTFEVVDGEGNKVTCTIKTDKATVGEALVELGLVEGTQESWGLMVTTVNGITADYEADHAYWAFYIDGEYAMTGVDATDITVGSTYTMQVEKG